MKKLYASFLLIISFSCLVSCRKISMGQQEKTVEDPLLAEHNANLPVLDPVLPLSMEGLSGKWLMLDSEGELDASGDYLLLEKKGTEYTGMLVYQNSTRQCTLTTDGKDYYVISKKGEKYKVSRVESSYKKEHNGIGLALIVGAGFDDIGLGFFQCEDVLKKLAE